MRTRVKWSPITHLIRHNEAKIIKLSRETVFVALYIYPFSSQRRPVDSVRAWDETGSWVDSYMFGNRYPIPDIISQISYSRYHISDIISQTSFPRYPITDIISQIGYHIPDIISQISNHRYHIPDIISQTSYQGRHFNFSWGGQNFF